MLLRWNGSLVDEFLRQPLNDNIVAGILPGTVMARHLIISPDLPPLFSFLGVDSHAGRSLRSALNFLGPDFWDFGNSSFR
jgi:hypothetical protein